MGMSILRVSANYAPKSCPQVNAGIKCYWEKMVGSGKNRVRIPTESMQSVVLSINKMRRHKRTIEDV